MDEAAPPGDLTGFDDIIGFAPFEVIEGAVETGLLLICDHASNALPAAYGTLGMAPSEFDRHIGYDIGAGALTRDLAKRIGAPAVLSLFSRLLIDPNRGEDDPTLVMRLSDGSVVPGNASVDAGERERRLNEYYRPYHQALVRQIDKAVASSKPPVLLSIHSFTQVWRGVARPWHGGILWDQDPRFAVPLLERLGEEDGLIIGDNEPYIGALKNDTMYRHGTERGLPHALLEVRNDLIADVAGVEAWADRLTPIVGQILDEHSASLHAIEQFGSKSDDTKPRMAGS